MWAEILVAGLKPGWKDADLARLMKWNTEYHAKDGIHGVQYFVSEDRSRFVMIVTYQNRARMERLRAKWDASGNESQAWFRSMMEPLFTEGQSKMFAEVKPGVTEPHS